MTEPQQSQSLITQRNIRIAYDSFGDSADPCILLIMGLGAQMRVWPDVFCKGLAEAGFFVIRFDNRDSGESSNFESQGNPNIAMTWLMARLKKTPNLPYTLDDMAGDVFDIIAALNLSSVHIIGASMGAMIGQICAASQPNKIRSLTSMMTADKTPILRPKLDVLLRLMRRPSCDNENIAIRYTIMMNDLIGSPDYPMSNDEVLQLATTNYQRSKTQTGYLRQLAAITANGNHRRQLGNIKAPTLIIHGKEDPLIPAKMGRNVARYIKQSLYHEIEGMGHNLPRALVPKLLPLVIAHIKASEKRWHRNES